MKMVKSDEYILIYFGEQLIATIIGSEVTLVHPEAGMLKKKVTR